MTTYKQICSREDKIFQSKARSVLGRSLYLKLVPLAHQAFQEGLKEPNVNKRENNAIRMANLVFSKAMSDKI
tara:strand:+ start:13586 stop:13801 length:216 start_codon:yes stop_codon:yes gene_type:complete